MEKESNMVVVDRSKRPRYGPWLDSQGNALCEECGQIMNPVTDRDAPWADVRFSGGVRIEIWHNACSGERYFRLNP